MFMEAGSPQREEAGGQGNPTYGAIVETIIRVGRAKQFIAAMCELIQRLTVGSPAHRGDIFDRGPGPHIIMDKLMTYHSVDIQWGNHDVLWMGAAAGRSAALPM